MSSPKKTLGQAIDEVVAALEPLDDSTRLTAVRAACEHLGLQEPSTQTPAAQVVPEEALRLVEEAPPSQAAATTIVTDIRSLRTQKKPKTDLEMACIVAYYLDALAPPGEQKQSISKADLERYFKQAGHKLPKRIDQLLVNAKAAGYMDSAARGRYKLNPVGHNLVVHTLPRAKS